MKHQLWRYVRSLYSVLKQYKLRGLITAFTSGAEFSQLIHPIGERVLILSGHPGDEVMALGGTMAKYAKNKVPMTLVTFTAGMRGTNTGRLSRALGPRRHKEQVAALKLYDESVKLVSWNLEEKFSVDDDHIMALLDSIDELNPDTIYTPSLLDNHPDSQAINRMLTGVLQRLPSTRLRAMTIVQYELWTPIVPNKILSIDGFEAIKQKAIECHESQLLCRDYMSAMIGLNRYRAAILGAGNYAEAYYVCSAPQFMEFLTTLVAPVIEMLP